MNFETAKINMIKQQIHTLGRSHEDITQAFMQTPREQFVPRLYENLAYSDMPIPISDHTHMLTPRLIAQAINITEIHKTDRVLVIHTETGYTTAICCHLASEVISIDTSEENNEKAKYRLKALGLYNPKFITCDIYSNDINEKPFDVIIIQGSLKSIPNKLFDNLIDSGRLFAILDNGTTEEGVCFTKEKGHIKKSSILDTKIDALESQPKETIFNF